MFHLAGKSSKIISPSQTNGHIQVIFGPMFSGKTTELLRRLKRYQVANHKCLIIKYVHDSRYSKSEPEDTSHTVDMASEENLQNMLKKAMDYTVIGIDEGQFFPDILTFSEKLASSGKIVIIAALDGTYQRKGFSNILGLVPLAESVIKLTAVCMKCYADASYTKRIGNETEVEVLGGTDKYMSVCRKCYEQKDSGERDSKLVSCDIFGNETQKCLQS